MQLQLTLVFEAFVPTDLLIQLALKLRGQRVSAEGRRSSANTTLSRCCGAPPVPDSGDFAGASDDLRLSCSLVLVQERRHGL